MTINMLDVKPIPGMRFGTVTTRVVPAESVYLAVPTSAIMSAKTAATTPKISTLLEDLDRRFGRGGELERMILFLMHERFRGRRSPFAPYLNTLPLYADMKFINPTLFTTRDVDLLAGTGVYSTITKSQRERDTRYNSLKRFVFDEYGSKHPWMKDHDLFLWAHTILDSRSIWFGGGRNLVPWLDMINCGGATPRSPSEPATPALRPHRTVLDESGKFAITKAARRFVAGEELLEVKGEIHRCSRPLHAHSLPLRQNYGQANYVYYAYHGCVESLPADPTRNSWRHSRAF